MIFHDIYLLYPNDKYLFKPPIPNKEYITWRQDSRRLSNLKLLSKALVKKVGMIFILKERWKIRMKKIVNEFLSYYDEKCAPHNN